MVTEKMSTTKEKLLKLMSERENLEVRIKHFGDVLQVNDNIGLEGSLLDDSGFPRADIDVYQVRQARQQIICLQNDHKDLMKQIEHLLHQLHAEDRDKVVSTEVRSMNVSGNRESTQIHNPNERLTVIAKVNLVSPGSPAEAAGIRCGDGILEFGTINSTNFDRKLFSIGNLVQNMQNRTVALKVEREGQQLDLILIPKSWSGRGLLGCNIILPYTNSDMER